MGNIWHVNYFDNRYIKAVSLQRLSDYWFRVVKAGAYPDILVGDNYSLIHKKYKDVFNGLEAQVTHYPAIVINDISYKDSYDYIELKIAATLNPVNYEALDTNGLKIWTYKGHIFVSADLGDKIEAIPDNGLYLTQDFRTLVNPNDL